MMSDKKHCSALPQGVVLRKISKDKVPRKFINEKQQLESVLGPSNPNWLEDASRRKLQQSTAVVRRYESVVDSPVLTPRISQICRDELKVGSTPDGSSYSPRTVERILSSVPCGSTPDTLLKPVLGNSPCLVSPISLTLGISQPGAKLARSLGANVEESALNWTNSLATPPRDVSLSAEKSPVDSGKTKDLARALFSPCKKLDTSCDSVNPLDSTCEDESCDLSADHGLANQSAGDVEQCDLHFGRNSEETVSVLKNVSNKNSYMVDSKKTITMEIDSKSPVLDENNVDRYFEVTGKDTVKRTSLSNASPEKLQMVSPLQNLVTSDLRPLNTSLNESADLTDTHCNKGKLFKTIDSDAVYSDAQESNLIKGGVSSPVMSPKNQKKETALMTSPTFSQKGARKRNKTVSENSPSFSPRFSIDSALSDFFDPPSSAVGRRKRAPQKRKSIDLDTSLEFEISDASIKCSTPKENVTLHSILSSKKKDKKSVKKVRFSDGVVTKKVTFSFENNEIEAYANDEIQVHSDSLVVKGPKTENDRPVIESLNQARQDFSKTKVENVTKHERGAEKPEPLKVSHDHVVNKVREVDNPQNVDKVKIMDLPVKSTENLTYCKRRGLKTRLKKDSGNGFGKNRLSDNKFDKSGESTADKSELNSETTNEIMRNSEHSEDSEAFSQVSPSALTEMCNIAHNASGDASTEEKHDKKATSTRNNNLKHSSLMGERSVSGSCPIVKNKDKLPVPKKMINSSPKENSLKPVLKSNQVTAPRKFFYPSSRQIATSCPRKVFEYKDEGERTENAGLVKSVSVKDIIRKHEQVPEIGKQIDREKLMDAESVKIKSETNIRSHTKVEEPKGNHIDETEFKRNPSTFVMPAQCVNGTKEAVNITRHQEVQQDVQSGGFKTGSGKTILVDDRELQKARRLIYEDDPVNPNVKFKSETGLNGFKSASGNCIKLKEGALRKAERLMNDDLNKRCNSPVNSIKVLSQSILKAQELISNASLVPKETKLSQSGIVNGWSTNNEFKVDEIDNMGENEQDYEFSQWFEEMEEEANLMEEEAMSGLSSLETSRGNTTNHDEMDRDFIEPLGEKGKEEHQKSITESIEVKETRRQMRIDKEMPVTEMVGFSTAAGKKIELHKAAMQNADNLIANAMSTESINSITKTDVKENKTKFDMDEIDATGDCHKLELVSINLHDAIILGNNHGFKTASGKMLHISNNALEKASNLVEKCFDGKENSYSEATQVRKLKLDARDSNKLTVSAKGGISKSDSCLSNIFKNELDMPLSNTESLEEELKALTSLKTKKQNHTAEFYVGNKMNDGFQGFTSASRSALEVSDIPLKKSVSLVNCDGEESVINLKQNFNKSRIEVNQRVKRDLPEIVKSAFSPEAKSAEEELDTLLTMKNTKLRTHGVANNHTNISPAVNGHKSEKNSRFPPGSNLPKGFRPFKAPRITKPKKPEDASANHERTIGMKHDNRFYEIKMVKDDKLFDNVNDLKMDNTASEIPDGAKSVEINFDKKDDSQIVSKKSLPSGNRLNSDQNSEQLEKRPVPEKVELVQEKHEPDVQDCYNGLLSQMFADEMEPDEVVNCNSLAENYLDSHITCTNTASVDNCLESRSCEKIEILENKHDIGILKLKEKKEIKKKIDTIRNNVQTHHVTDSLTAVGVGNLNMENDVNIKLGGFATASGTKIKVKAESLSRAETVLNDCSSEPSYMLENKSVVSRTEGADDCIVPDLEVIHQSSENKVQKYENSHDLPVPNSNDAATSYPSCMFKTASGKQLDISDEMLTIASSKFNDMETCLDNIGQKSRENVRQEARPQEVPDLEPNKSIGNSSNSIEGAKDVKPNDNESDSPQAQMDSLFQTASKITLKVERNSLRDSRKNTEVSNNSLFQSESGKSVSVSETVVKAGRGNLDDTIEEPKASGSSLLQTASGKSLIISETLLKVARDNFEDLDKELHIPKTVSGSLFQTASGKNVSISEKSLQHARDSLQVSEFDSDLLKSENNSLFQTDSSFETKSKSGSFFQTASGKDINVSEEALKNVRSRFNDSDLELMPKNEGNTLFQTASGKNVAVPDEALKVARKSLQEVDKELDSIKSEVGSLFQTASGKNVTVSEKALTSARNKLESGGSLKPKISTDSSFQTARGKSVTISDTAVKKARKILDDIDAKSIQLEPECSTSLFKTASGENMNISEQPLKVAVGSLNIWETNVEKPKVSCGSMFQTASGKNVNISEEALHRARKSLNDSDTNLEIKKISSGSMFQTASGKKVNISEEALSKARDNLTDSEANIEIPKLSGSSIFQTASGRIVNISEKSLKVARENLKDSESDLEIPKMSCGSVFQTASGKHVAVSDKAVKETKDNWNDSTVDLSIPKYPSSSLFQTASGKNITVSEKVLKVARDSFRETETSSLSAGKDDSRLETSGSLADAKHCVGSLFQTASGKNVPVSDKALRAARESFRDSETTNMNIEKEENFRKNSSVNQNSTSSGKSAGSLFQTASGKNVMISENALKVARDSFRDSETDNLHGENENISMENSSRNQQHGSLPSISGSLFQTASGKNVIVSEKALKFARDSLRDPESNNVAIGKHDSFEKNSSGDQNVRPPSMSGVSLFQTASGKNVTASENALSIARSALEYYENKNGQESVFTTVKSEQLQKTSANQGMESLSTSLEALSSMKRKMFESRGDTGTGKPDVDEGDQDRTPSKRQRLDGVVGSIRGDQSERAPFRSGPEGLLTDRWFATCRGFKPVRSQTLFKTPARIALNDLTKDVNSASKRSTPTKSSFQTPYRTTPTKTPEPSAPTTANVIVHTPVFIPKAMGSELGKETMKNTHAIDGKDTHTKGVVSFLGKRMTSETLRSRLDRKGKENIENGENDLGTESDTVERNSDTLALPSAEKRHIKGGNTNGTGDNADCRGDTDRSKEMGQGSDNGIRDNAQTEETEPNTNENIFNDRMDDCTQNDDAEIFYCNLVEARKHQEDMLKQKQKWKIQPVQGQLYRLKQCSGRWKQRDFVRVLRQSSRQRVSKPVPVTCSTARDYKFRLKDFYGDDVTHVLVGDGAYLVPDDAGCVGIQEFYSAFLTMDGVEPKLISDVWVHNHYRWIIWKLAAYEVVCPSNSIGRFLTPEMVMLQLKYRYDREVDRCERSSLKKIFERDDAHGKRLVLCVAGVIRTSEIHKAAGNQETASHDLDDKILLELTDGWYSIKAQLDVPLTDLVRQGRITVGQKLCMSGAELVGGDDACSPLEAPDSVMLKISCNSCRPAPCDSILGYQPDPRPLCVPLTGLRGEGGTVGVMDLIIVRKYPIMYMEKLPGGGYVFRTDRAEEKTQRTFQSKQQENMEKIYRQIEQEMEREEKEERQSISKKKWSRSEVEYLQNGREIYEALTSSRQPDIIEGLLTDKQIVKLMDYKRQLHDEKQQELNSRFQKTWQDRDEGVSVRNVTPVLKFRVAGCAHRDMDNKTTTILTVWRPVPGICDLEEGKRYKVYSLNTSTARSKYVGHEVQLTATKHTKFQLMNVDENFLDNIYEPREVLWGSDISRGQPPYGEVDFVGVVVQVSQPAVEESFSRQPDTVYCADCQGNLLAIKFWQGIKLYDDCLLTVGNTVCCSNLMDKLPYRCRQLPAVEASTEFTHITNKPQNSEQRQAVTRLNAALKDKRAFLEKATSLLAETLEKRQNYRPTPEKRKYSSTTFSEGEITPTKTANHMDHQKAVAMETKHDFDLSMSVDSSFEEEICKADLDSVFADQGNVTSYKHQKTESTGNTNASSNRKDIPDQNSNVLTLKKDGAVYEHPSSNSVCSTAVDLSRTEALTNNDHSHTDALTSDNHSHINALIGDERRNSEPPSDPDQVKSMVDSDQEYAEETNESESQSQSADNRMTETLPSTPKLNKELVSSNSKISQTAANQSALYRTLEEEDNVSGVNLQTPNVQQNRARGDKELLNSDATKFQTPANQSNLVRSPEEELIMKLIPQTPDSQHSMSGLTPQTPSSQQGRAVYQAKMARLLSYASPSPLTPIRTPVSRTVTKGFKPPSFVKK